MRYGWRRILYSHRIEPFPYDKRVTIAMKKILILFLCGLFLVSCEPKPPSIFTNLICEPPCWENITPGVTTKNDALTTLSKISAIDQPIHHTQPVPGFDEEIGFTLYKDINKLGSIDILKDRVSRIGFGYNRMGITLQDAIRLFGMPESILIVHVGEIYSVTFVDPQKGIEFGYYFRNNATEILPKDGIMGIAFFDPKQYQLFLNTGFFSYGQMGGDETIKRMRPWKGYGSISQYETSG